MICDTDIDIPDIKGKSVETMVNSDQHRPVLY